VNQSPFEQTEFAKFFIWDQSQLTQTPKVQALDAASSGFVSKNSETAREREGGRERAYMEMEGWGREPSKVMSARKWKGGWLFNENNWTQTTCIWKRLASFKNKFRWAPTGFVNYVFFFFLLFLVLNVSLMHQLD